MGSPDNQHAERDIFNIKEAGDIHIHNRALPVRPRNEQILLTAVRNEIESRLATSLHNTVFLNLGKEAQPNQVKRPWDREIKIGTQSATAISDDTTIAQVFDSPAIGGKLLILGQPGAGKTTTLLDLAKALVEKAKNDANYPVPLLFNLSSWKDERQPIREWMVAELKSKYGVSTKLGQQWVSERVLLPLLDGLDEVAPERQGQCIQAINVFLSGELAPLYVVVCSRVTEYENHQIPLGLNGAVYLNELKDSQIEDYLLKVGRQELWNVIASSPELLAFVRAPLLLSMTVIAYSPGMREQWQQLQTTENQLQYLLDAYVVQMLHRQIESRSYGKQKQPNPRQTRHWLRWLAIQMDQASQTEFLIEEMQPSMLPESKRESYRLSFGLIGGLQPTIKPVEVLSFSRKKSLFRLIGGLIAGLFIGLIDGLFVGLFVGPIVGLFIGLIFGLEISPLDVKTLPNQGIKRSAMNWLIGGLIGGLVFGLIGWWTGGLIGGLVFGLISGLIGGLVLGGEACIQHFILRILLYQSKLIPWNYARFLDYCTESLLLQRVGGRYRFVHKLLQDHFARMSQEPL